MSLPAKYKVTIGLEIHVQLATRSKLFCGDSIIFGEEPNTQISAISLAHPGTLPRTNALAVEFAVRMGIACNCRLEEKNFFARKNYFYPDLPKGYQVSQHTVPICSGGYVKVLIDGAEKMVRLNRIHLEEDAGKSIHDIDADLSCIDHNRAGTPLIEIVTEPCIHSSEEAARFLAAIQKLVRWLDISDGNMEQGNLRCDANISINEYEASELGTKVEVKNLNSIRNIKKAIDYEANRMIEMLESGETIIQQTRSFDASTDTTFSLRDKEEANDYRYFADPDIAPFMLSKEFTRSVTDAMPELPQSMETKLREKYGLSAYDAIQLTEEKEIASFYLSLTDFCKYYKAAANWINGPVKKYLNENNIPVSRFCISTTDLAALVTIVEEGKLSFSIASSKVFPEMISSGKKPLDIIAEMNLYQVSDIEELNRWIDMVVTKLPEKINEYKKGKKGLIGLFVGEIKKISKGKADPKMVSELLEKKLNS